ncbi:FAD-binding protein [Streptomyces sp. NPDC056844]|uniref:FAD-binding protein n=1 Tax=unclassified Streptomyces TaxID=2593676 RepID=UPI0036BF8C9B
MVESTDVVVIGGGCAGVMAAHRPARHGKVTVTPISLRPAFTHRLRPHHLVGGTGPRRRKGGAGVPAHRSPGRRTDFLDPGRPRAR